MFESLGLTKESLAVYRALLQRPELIRTAHIGDLATTVEVTESEVEALLGRLRELGLLVPRWNIPDEEYPLDPRAAFDILAGRRQQEIDQLSGELNADRTEAAQFVADYSDILVQKTAGGVEVLEGERAYQRMQHFEPVKSSWAMFPPDPVPLSRPPEETGDIRFLERRVDARYLVVESQLKVRGTREYIDYIRDYGAEVRAVPSVPLKMIIFDGEAVVVGIDPDNNAVGAMVHHSKAVLRIAVDLYEHYWRRARPVIESPLPQENDLTAQEAEFLRLLVQGATDDQVGRKLGVSLRTVRRIAAKLSEQVGASGRFELGVRAAQRGWVD
ncbi:helix-turn-helix domain-containing protein [Kribbella sp. NPDC051936]|uniref:helix-turn-helix transcriptional regulator n=1 Tax=Kribbella sp. NPDC051936 TaxID=3154946 RepID=UPI00342D9892